MYLASKLHYDPAITLICPDCALSCRGTCDDTCSAACRDGCGKLVDVS